MGPGASSPAFSILGSQSGQRLIPAILSQRLPEPEGLREQPVQGETEAPREIPARSHCGQPHERGLLPPLGTGSSSCSRHEGPGPVALRLSGTLAMWSALASLCPSLQPSTATRKQFPTC